MKELIDFFIRHPNLNFTKKEAKIVSKFFDLKTVKKDEIIFREGETPNEMFILKNGSVSIYRKGYLGDIKITTVNETEIFGEIGLIDKLPRTANAKSDTDCELLVLTEEKIAILKEKYPKIAIKLMELILKTMSQRLRATTTKLL